ncbi:MAG TPA: hypothetical protein VHL11_03190 [Phototrophicaceae bacterium]|jgi:hypothetical protein|nr:hypothetical protein [Phototrophicaceae bacterium]
MLIETDAELETLCQQERSRKTYIDACYELFRRALEFRQPETLDRIYILFQPQVRGWVINHGAFDATHETDDFFVNEAFNFLRHLEGDQFQKYPTVPHILGYMKKCLGHLILRYRLPTPEISLDELELTGETDVKIETLLSLSELEDRLHHLLDEKEHRIFDYHWREGLKPKLIHELEPALGTADEIREQLKTIRRRLRGDHLFRHLLGLD